MYAMVEVMMDHIATYLDKPPLDVRLANMDCSENAKTINYINRMKEWSEFKSRMNEVQDFNKVQLYRNCG